MRKNIFNFFSFFNYHIIKYSSYHRLHCGVHGIRSRLAVADNMECYLQLKETPIFTYQIDKTLNS